MYATHQRLVARGALALSFVVACGAVMADPPGRAGGPGEWRDYYQERERREAREKQEKREQERVWRNYYRERERHGYYPAPGSPGPSIEIRIGGYFGYGQWIEVDHYFRDQARRGFCPPGLAKKGNGCLPPGQAKGWTIGRPLPPDIVYYPLEPAVRVRLGPPPAGHEFIRVAGDILLIAVGTGLVIDALQDLGR